MEQFGQYQLIRCIAVGGMGELFLAQRDGVAGFSKQLVVKRIRDRFVNNPDFVSMFLNEGRVAALLDHPNIVHIYELGEVNGNYFLAMEYVPGKNLAAVIERLQGPLPLPLALYVVAQMCEALSFAHAATAADGRSLGLVHRDVSPPNVLVAYSGAVKLTDFGIAKVVRSQQTAAGVLKGKLSYLSPEQARGERLDKRSDIFALGLVLFEATTGHRAVPGEADTEILYAVAHGQLRRPEQYDPNYPSHLAAIYRRATAKNPEDRYQDAKEMQDDLLRFQLERKMIVTAAKMGSFMQSTFSEAARAAGEAIYDSMEIVGDGSGAGRASPSSMDASDPSFDPTLCASPMRRAAAIRSEPTASVEPDSVDGPMAALHPPPSPAPRGALGRDPDAPSGAGGSVSHEHAVAIIPSDEMPALGPAPVASTSTGRPCHGDQTVLLPDIEPEGVVSRRAGRPLPTHPVRQTWGLVDDLDDRPTPLLPVRAVDGGQQAATTGRPTTGDRSLSAASRRRFGTGSSEQVLPAGSWVDDSVERSGRSRWRPLVIVVTALITLSLGFGTFVLLSARTPWGRDLRAHLGLDQARHTGVVGDAGHVGARRDAGPVRPHAAAVDLRVLEPDVGVEPGDAAASPAEDVARAVAGQGRLRIESQPRMMAHVGGRPAGFTPTIVSVAAGPVSVRLLSSRHKISLTREVQVAAGEMELLRVVVAKGRLMVRVRPWAHVFVDGVKRGTTPMAPISLYAGRHELKLVNDSTSHRAQVTVREGRTTLFTHRFD